MPAPRLAECKLCGSTCRTDAKYCSRECYARSYTLTHEERFWSRVDKTQTCWNWIGGLNHAGYARIRVNGRARMAHAWAYEQKNGAVPSGLELDHLCRNRRCVNPAHLEPVTHTTNIQRGAGRAPTNARKTRCRNGHAFSVDNLVTSDLKYGQRRCRTCWNKYQRQRRTEKRLNG